jgi:membrane protein required for colicin V production
MGYGNGAWKISLFALSRSGEICYPYTVSVFDVIVLAILAALTLRGVWKGMISQIVSVAALFVCWIVATRFGGLIAPTIPVEAPWNQVLAMGVFFLITYIAIQFGRAALEKIIKHWHLQKLNTLLGGLLGFAKGLLICMIITFFAVMVSVTSRTVVFNSMTGFHLVRLITGIAVFVPKDSYEFVHAQFAQFQEKVDEAVPGQIPDPLKIPNSEDMQQALAKLRQTNGQPETSAASLWSALSNWWKGEKDDSTTETLAQAEQTTAQKNVPPQSMAATYIPSLPSNIYANTPQSVVPQPVTATDIKPFFARQPETYSPSPPSVPGLPSPQPSSLAPLQILAPFPEPETQLAPLQSIQNHVGSDLLLNNSRQPPKPNTSASVFRPR